ncbi:unnamed protein product, partial [Prorocentrum cordatum]
QQEGGPHAAAEGAADLLAALQQRPPSGRGGWPPRGRAEGRHAHQQPTRRAAQRWGGAEDDARRLVEDAWQIDAGEQRLQRPQELQQQWQRRRQPREAAWQARDRRRQDEAEPPRAFAPRWRHGAGGGAGAARAPPQGSLGAGAAASGAGSRRPPRGSAVPIPRLLATAQPSQPPWPAFLAGRHAPGGAQQAAASGAVPQ